MFAMYFSVLSLCENQWIFFFLLIDCLLFTWAEKIHSQQIHYQLWSLIFEREKDIEYLKVYKLKFRGQARTDGCGLDRSNEKANL